jgi:hypothetical protein
MLRFSRVIIVLALCATGACPDRGLADSRSDVQDCRSQNLDVNIAACTRIIEDPATSEQARTESYLQRGLAYVSQNALISAARDFDKVIGSQPGNATALAGRAIVKFRRGDTAQSILDYSLARRLDPAAVDAVARNQEDIGKIAAAAERAPAPQAQIDELARGLIRCLPGTRQDGSACVPIVCAEGQRLDGNSCVEIVCGAGYQRQGSRCVAVLPPPPPPPPAPPSPPPPPPPPTLLASASASRWCTPRRTYVLSLDGDKIVWRDNFGAVDIERVLSDGVYAAQTVTLESRHTGSDTVARGTVWNYAASGRDRINVSKSGGASFSLSRC